MKMGCLSWIVFLFGIKLMNFGSCSILDFTKSINAYNKEGTVLTLLFPPNKNLSQTNFENFNRSKLILINVEHSNSTKINQDVQRIIQIEEAAAVAAAVTPEKNKNIKKRATISTSNKEIANISLLSQNNVSHQGYYYEEQSPVVIHSEAGPMSITNGAISQPLQQDSDYNSAVNNYFDGETNRNDDNYYEYTNDDGSLYGEEKQSEETSMDYNAKKNEASPRFNQQWSSHYPGYDEYNRYQAATPSSLVGSGLQQQQQQQYNHQGHQQDTSSGYRKPSASYASRENDFSPLTQKLQYHQRPQTSNEEPSTLLSLVQRLKSMWEMYQAFSSALNTVAERQRQSYQRRPVSVQPAAEPESRINSKKPMKIETMKESFPSSMMDSNGKYNSSDDSSIATTPAAISERYRRNANEVKPSNETSVGRYIKGDPLKGYYDFVITEGSYKFWAAFQVGTAILIIYSTFAAIYYSKVNPLVSDYDYTDYLGGGRSLADTGDADFVDDDMAERHNSIASHRASKWLDMAGHTVKFILSAIDRLPQEDELNKEDEDGGKRW